MRLSVLSSDIVLDAWMAKNHLRELCRKLGMTGFFLRGIGGFGCHRCVMLTIVI
jgi:hypothetical protein